MYIFAYHFSSIDRGHVTDYTNLHIYFKFTYICIRLFRANEFFFVSRIYAKWQILLPDEEKSIKFVSNKLDLHGTSPKYDVLILFKLCRIYSVDISFVDYRSRFRNWELTFLRISRRLVSLNILQTTTDRAIVSIDECVFERRSNV